METKIETEKITAKQIFRLSEQLAEPRWLRETRLRALEQFNRTPWPTCKEEIWRKTKIRHFQGANFPPPQDSFGTTGVEEIKEIPKALRQKIGTAEDFSAFLLQRRNRAAQQWNPEKEKGILLFDLPHATRHFGEELAAIFNEWESNFVAGKLEFLQEAFWNAGTYLKVPENCTAGKPIFSVTQHGTEAESIFPQTVIFAGSNSSVTLVEMVTAEAGQVRQIRNHRVKILASPNARVNYFLLAFPGVAETAFTSIDVVGRRNSSVQLGIFQIGGALSKTHIRTNLEGKGASADIRGLYFVTHRQHMDLQTFQNHAVGRTDSNLRVKGAAAGRAHAVFRGVIHIETDAQNTSAYQLNNNLLLSAGAHVDSNPVLEIEADDVRCTHGATVGPIDPEQLFYLQSRGLPREIAHRLIVEGFFDSEISILPTENLRKMLHREIEHKMERF